MAAILDRYEQAVIDGDLDWARKVRRTHPDLTRWFDRIDAALCGSYISALSPTR